MVTRHSPLPCPQMLRIPPGLPSPHRPSAVFLRQPCTRQHCEHALHGIGIPWKASEGAGSRRYLCVISSLLHSTPSCKWQVSIMVKSICRGQSMTAFYACMYCSFYTKGSYLGCEFFAVSASCFNTNTCLAHIITLRGLKSYYNQWQSDHHVEKDSLHGSILLLGRTGAQG